MQQTSTANSGKKQKHDSARRQSLNLFFLLDNSNSMADRKVEVLNRAVFENARRLLEEFERKERAQILIRIIRFGDKAEWHIGPAPVRLDQFQRVELDGNGGSSCTAQAIELLREELDSGTPGNLPPVCILVSDGYCTAPPGEYEEALKKLDLSEQGMKAVRLSVAITVDGAVCDERELYAFISPRLREMGKEVLSAKSFEEVGACIEEAVRTGLRIALGREPLDSEAIEPENPKREEEEKNAGCDF